jgi:hypothetical protein
MYVINCIMSLRVDNGFAKGSITLAFFMCSLDVHFTVACVFGVIFEFFTLKITLKRSRHLSLSNTFLM